MDRHLLPALGNVAVAALRPEHLDAIYRDLLTPVGIASPSRGDRAACSWVAHRALNVGVRWGWIATNPASGTLPPRLIPRPITHPRPLTLLL